ncbi:hypothetical protein [Wenzhou Pipistrellus abramus orthohepevirus 1]|nr:hypothetical protein [Wenzhou Pipistrellus abramus orthohepevirus 1]
MVLVGIPEPVGHLQGGVAPAVAAPAVVVLPGPIRHPPRPSPPRLLLLGLSLSPTLISVGLFSGASTTLLLAHFPFLFLVPQMLFFTPPPYLLFSLCKTDLMLTSCRRRLVITLSTGWLQQPSGGGRLSLRASVGFL